MDKPTVDGLVEQAERQEAGAQLEPAIVTWRQILAIERTPYHLLRYSAALEDAGHFQESEKAARESLELEGPTARSYSRLGLALRAAGRLDEARVALERSVAIEESQPILTILGNVCYRLSDFASSEAAFRRSLALDPDDCEAKFGLGLAVTPARPAQAIEYFLEVLKSDPSIAEAEFHLARVQLATQRYADAESTARHALENEPGDPWLRCFLAQALEGQGDFTGAVAQLERSIELNGREPYFRSLLARAHERLGRPGIPDRLYREALALDAGDRFSNLWYGLFLERSGQASKAIRYVKRALEADPSDITALAALDRLQRSS